MDEIQKIIEQINKEHKENLVWIFEDLLPYKGLFSSHRTDFDMVDDVIDFTKIEEYEDPLWDRVLKHKIENCYCGHKPFKLFNFIPSIDGEYNEYTLICPKCQIPVSVLSYINDTILNWNLFVNLVKADETGKLRKELEEREID